jgi:hypothetical protein
LKACTNCPTSEPNGREWKLTNCIDIRHLDHILWWSTNSKDSLSIPRCTKYTCIGFRGSRGIFTVIFNVYNVYYVNIFYHAIISYNYLIMHKLSARYSYSVTIPTKRQSYHHIIPGLESIQTHSINISSYHPILPCLQFVYSNPSHDHVIFLILLLSKGKFQNMKPNAGLLFTWYFSSSVLWATSQVQILGDTQILSKMWTWDRPEAEFRLKYTLWANLRLKIK